MRKSLLASLVLATLWVSSAGAESYYSPANQPGGADNESLTAKATEGLYLDDADRYLNVVRYWDVESPVFFFQFSPSTIGSSNTVSPVAEPLKVGFGAPWSPSLFTGTHYEFNAGTTGTGLVQNVDNTTLVGTGNVATGYQSVETATVNYTDYSYHSPRYWWG